MGQYLLLIAILVFLPLFLAFNIVRFTHEILKDHIEEYGLEILFGEEKVNKLNK